MTRSLGVRFGFWMGLLTLGCLFGLGSNALAARLIANGYWSNPAIWDSPPFNANDGNWNNNIFLVNNKTVTLDGKYVYDYRLLYQGVDWMGGGGVFNVPTGTGAIFARGVGIGDSADASLNVTGGWLKFTGDPGDLWGSRGNNINTYINLTGGLIQAQQLRFFASSASTPGRFYLNVGGYGTLSIGSGGAVREHTGGTLVWTVGERGRVVIDGNKLADPTLGGLLSAKSGTLQARLTTSGRTVITDANPGPRRSRFIYDFETLSLGGLAGQDNWGIFAQNNSQVTTGSGLNTTKTAAGVAGVSIMARPNNGNFAFLPFSGAETQAIIQFDLYWNPSMSTSAGVVALGNDTTQAMGPFFGISGIGSNPAGFYIRQAGGGQEHVASLGGAVSTGDWVRLQLRADFTANSGNGAGSLYYQNLTRGDTTFTPVSGLQNIPLNLSVAPPSTWNTLGFRFDHGQNLRIDNIVPNGRVWNLSTYARAVLEDYPAAYWRLGEKSASPGPWEQVTNQVRGSYSSGVTFGLTPGALLNETHASAVRPSTSGVLATDAALGQALFGGQSELTVEFWVRPNASQSGIHYFEYGNDGLSQFSLEGTSLKPAWWINSTAKVGEVDLTQGVFQHVALVYDGVAGEARIYRNGQLVSLVTSGVPSAINNLNMPFYLGGRYTGSWQRIPNADFQELAIYQRVLSGEEIYAHYYASIVPEPASWVLLALGGMALAGLAAIRRWKR